MGIFGNNSCYFSIVDLTEATGSDLEGLENVRFGIWSRQAPPQSDYYGYCEIYSSYEENFFVDSKWRASRAMAVIANLCGGIAMVIAITLSCTSVAKMWLHIAAFLSFCAGFFQCLVFIYFSSDACDRYSCQFSQGAGVAVGAAVAYLLNMCVWLKIPMYEGNDDDRFTPAAAVPATNAQDPPPGSVQVTVTDMPDGTKKTTRTVVNADGSKTVTETIEQ